MSVKLDGSGNLGEAKLGIPNNNRPNLLQHGNRPGIPSLNIPNSRKSSDDFELKEREIGLDIEESKGKKPEHPAKASLKPSDLENSKTQTSTNQQLKFPKKSTLVNLNRIFKKDPSFLTALVMITDKNATLNKVRDSLADLSDPKDPITFLKKRVERIPSKYARQILDSFLKTTDGKNAYTSDCYTEGDKLEALPEFMSPFISLLTVKAAKSVSERSNIQLRKMVGSLDLENECQPVVKDKNDDKAKNEVRTVGDDKSEISNTAPTDKDKDKDEADRFGQVSDVQEVTLRGERGFFKKSINLGTKRGNVLPGQAQDIGMHYKDGLIFARNIVSSEVARELGCPNLCVAAQRAYMKQSGISEIGLFSREAPGSSVINFSSENLGKLSISQKTALIKQLLFMVAFNYITGEVDPNCGNMNLFLGENNEVQLCAFDRDFSLGEIGEGIFEGLCPLNFSSEEVASAVENFDSEKIGKQMLEEGFPLSQVEAMKSRVEKYKEKIATMRKNGKLYSNEDIEKFAKTGFGRNGVVLPEVDRVNPVVNWMVEILRGMEKSGEILKLS